MRSVHVELLANHGLKDDSSRLEVKRFPLESIRKNTVQDVNLIVRPRRCCVVLENLIDPDAPAHHAMFKPTSKVAVYPAVALPLMASNIWLPPFLKMLSALFFMLALPRVLYGSRV